MLAVEFLLNAISFLLLVPVVVIFGQVLAACLPQHLESEISPNRSRLAVLIPAHNEAEGIAGTINSISPQLSTTDRMVVVADNCTDRTSQVAAEFGAEVIERTDLTRMGKGYALDYGIQYLARNPPEILVIIDADCHIEELGKLVSFSEYHGRPVQCLYLMRSHRDANTKTKIAEFAWVVKNQVRPLGYARLGLPCQLMGSGMAIPWNLLSDVSLANGNIVEDLKLGIDLTILGNAPIFYPGTLVTSHFPLSNEAQKSQRIRWEHGHLSMMLSQVPLLISQSVMKGNRELMAIALDLCVPPLALLVAMLAGFWLLVALSYLAGHSYMPLLITSCSIVLMLIAIMVAWWGWGRRIITLFELLIIPIYVIIKLPYYVKFLFKRQKQWVRTDRKN